MAGLHSRGLNSERPSRRPSAARSATALGILSLGIALLVWIPVARALVPADAPPGWYLALAGGRRSVYAALYPLFHWSFVLLLPALVIAPLIQAALFRLFRNATGAASKRPTSPVEIRALASTLNRSHLDVDRTPRARLRSALALQLGAVSILILVGLALSGARDTIGLVLGISTCALALLVLWRDSIWVLSALGLLALVQAATFVLVLGKASLPFTHRPLLVLTSSLYLAIPVYLIGMLRPKPKVGALIALATALTAGTLAVEGVASWIVWARGGFPAVPTTVRDAGYVLRNRGPVEEHPEMGPIPVPNSVSETLYPDNPRGYFGTRSRTWRLATAPSSDATLELTGDGIGVVIDRADDPAPYRIYAERRGLAVVEGTQYVLRFRVRATQEREYRVGVTMARPPGGGVGLFFNDTAGPEWRSVTLPFTATVSEDSARVDLRLGGDTADVYVSDMTVTRAEDGARVDGGSGLEHYVSYRWNSRGCRAPEYPTPAAPGTFRILALGDSYTMGRGVHAEDIFTAVVERLLRRRAAEARDSTRFEVLGCGVSGFSTREERQYYEARADAYRPDLVLLVMVADDHGSSADDAGSEVARTPTRWEYLLGTGHLVQSILRYRPAPDVSASMEELERLHELVRSDGAELAVVLFAQRGGRASQRLGSSASATADALDVPILDLRDALASGGASTDLTVHPLDGHPNEIAHRIAAETIADWMEREGLIPRPSSTLDTGDTQGP